MTQINKKLVGLTPLLAIAMIGALAIGATYYLMFSSQVSTSITVRGLTAQTIQAGAKGLYDAKVSATTLSNQMHGPENSVLYAGNVVNTVVLTHNLLSEDLRFGVKLVDDDTELALDTSKWTASPHYTSFGYISGAGAIANSFGGPAFDSATSTEEIKYYTIAYADIPKITWQDQTSLPTPTSPNDLLTSITFNSAYGSDFGPKSYRVEITLEVIQP